MGRAGENWFTENCDDGNGVDNDACPNDCRIGAELCRDNLDNDADGQSDCDDLECQAAPFC